MGLAPYRENAHFGETLRLNTGMVPCLRQWHFIPDPWLSLRNAS